MPRLSHDQLARRIASKLGGVYNPGKGADIRIGNRVIKVEAHPRTFSSGIRQLRGYSGYRDLGVNNIDVAQAKERTQEYEGQNRL